MEEWFTCPCCGYLTLSEPPSGTFEICEVCGWEDDRVQLDDPDWVGGANGLSLRQAQKNFAMFGPRRPIRGGLEQYRRDPDWKPLPQGGA